MLQPRVLRLHQFEHVQAGVCVRDRFGEGIEGVLQALHGLCPHPDGCQDSSSEILDVCVYARNGYPEMVVAKVLCAQ